MWTRTTSTTFIPTTASVLNPATTTTDVMDTDDFEFNIVVRKTGDKKGKVSPPTSDHVKKNRKVSGVHKDIVEGEEGSTPNVVMYTPGYDYVVEERRSEEEEIIDLDVSSVRNPLESTTVQTSPPTLHMTTKAITTTYSTPLTSTETQRRTTQRLSNPNISPYGPWTHRISLTTPTHSVHTTRAPSTATKSLSTAVSAQPTVKIIKVKKPAATQKKSSPNPRGKKPSSRPKGPAKNQNQNQRQQNPNLMAKESVNMDVYWVVGNWSEVGSDMWHLDKSNNVKCYLKEKTNTIWSNISHSLNKSTVSMTQFCI